MTILQTKKCLRRWANATHRSLGGMARTPFWGSKAAALYAQYQHSIGQPATGVRTVVTGVYLEFWLNPGRVYLSPSQQAHNPYTGNQGVESTHMREVASYAAKRLRACGVTTRVAADWSKLKEPACYMNAVRDSNAWKPDCHVAPHSNASGSAAAAGTDTFYKWGGWASRHLAECLQRHVAPVSPGKDRGIHAQAGWAELNVAAPAALIEIAYHTNPADTKAIVQHPALFGYALADGVLEYLTK
jgi:N-acetylmuramoyl-L-alanine amidase